MECVENGCVHQATYCLFDCDLRDVSCEINESECKAYQDGSNFDEEEIEIEIEKV